MSAAPAKSARSLRKDELREGIDAAVIVAAESLAPTCVKQGYLSKRSDNSFVKNWKRRWVVLHGSLLYYFESPESKKPQGALPGPAPR